MRMKKKIDIQLPKEKEKRPHVTQSINIKKTSFRNARGYPFTPIFLKIPKQGEFSLIKYNLKALDVY